MELLVGAFALMFTALKLTGHIKWSWQLVLAPVWVPLVLIFVVGLSAVWSRCEVRHVIKGTKRGIEKNRRSAR